ncbi:flavin monoamine oxidase family protein [Aquabacter spiritensis]|uniref:Tryptophan 2-monooxygenase n=1 Tax=Aquabacter spiritensis TaxID=933073 RepID=A0A4R3M1H1_9HYPH|nr:NAD(P)/FAD-dependent oxidoreductase [Aquabacter spiritensis]TCT06842.1 monoamine oxidase [Aquabacter spiritensis]
MSDDYDVAVIGAGAAGLAAGAALAASGVRFVVLEAADRTGGRAFTDTETFDRPWDLGCHWLHSADHNPFTAIADRLGFAYGSTPTRLVRNLFFDGAWASAPTAGSAAHAVDSAFAAVRAAGLAGRDVAASAVVADAGCWNPLVRHWLALMTASPPEDVSTADFAAYSGTEANWPVLDGYGALVRANGAAVPVTLACPVTDLDWSRPQVRLSTPRGTVTARAAIVCVPVPVIAQGRLAFAPALPPPLAEAFAGLTLGVAEKVAIGFDRDVFGFSERTAVTVCSGGRAPVNFQILAGPQPVAIGHIAGDTAAALVRSGEAAMSDFVLAALSDAFGSEISRHVGRVRATSWARDPWIGGGYSSALPGRAHLRERLLAPLGDRVFFAGEAVARSDFSTCHGAHLSGIAAARACLAAMSRAA